MMNWLDIESKIDSQYRVDLTQFLQLFGIPGRIYVPPVIKFFWSKSLHFFFHCIFLMCLIMNFQATNWSCISFNNYSISK